MIVQNLKNESIEQIHKLLRGHAQRLTNADPQRYEPEIIITNQPSECFSIQSRHDLEYVTNETKFWNYVTDNIIPIYTVRRGGGIMWHGPGQIIMDPCVSLSAHESNPTAYSKILEESCLDTLAEFGIEARTNHYTKGAHGVWAMDSKDSQLKKIAFFGHHVSKGIAIGGCAINVSCDLYPLSLIFPCNLEGVEATSIKSILGEAPSTDEVANALIQNFLNIMYAKSP